jgi:site-specific recombinase XerD
MECVDPIRDKKKIEAMKKCLKGQSVRDYLMFEVGISSALRISDILQLKVSDVWDGNKPATFIKLREDKTNKGKGFPVTKNLNSAIRDYMKEYNHVSSNDHLFFSRKGINTPITRQHAHIILSKAAQEVGIKDKISTHSMRKTWGYWAYKSGVNLALIMEALNHSSIRETKRYLGITQDDLNEVYINLNL